MWFVANGVGKDLIAFDCMMSDVGDVAFVDLKNIEGKIGMLIRHYFIKISVSI